MSILLCYDGSPSAKHAISVAHETLGHMPATLLHVWNSPVEFLAAAPFGTASGEGGPSIAELERLSLERAQEIAQEGNELARELGLAVDTRIERNDSSVWQTILGVAAETDAELIVIGTHGATAVQSLLLGSVSNAVIHHSKRRVLVVPAETR
jgi:nucleotide-binding universal stress UspA family protein